MYEREVCDAFSAALGRPIKRNIGQARDGGNDIDVGPLVVECKRRKTLGTVYGWLNQAIAALPKIAGTGLVINSKIPVVVARQDQGESIVILRLTDFLDLVNPTIERPDDWFFGE